MKQVYVMSIVVTLLVSAGMFWHEYLWISSWARNIVAGIMAGGCFIFGALLLKSQKYPSHTEEKGE